MQKTETRPDEARSGDRQALFETAPVAKALARMALPTIASQIIALVYNIADTWFIGRTDDPYKIAAASLVLTVFLMSIHALERIMLKLSSPTQGEWIML